MNTFLNGPYKNFFLARHETFCYISPVLIVIQRHTQRVRIAIHVILRMTAMDVCCGPPFLR
jgi:hypothetical protein